MKNRMLVVLSLGAVLVALPASALGSAARESANSATFQDSTGEDASAPDITTVAVSNDDSGLITFKIGISNRPALTPDMAVVVYLNTDRKASTGDTQLLGSDYVIDLESGGVELLQWNGSDFAPAASQASLTYSYDATGATLRVSAADLARTQALNFAAVAVSGIAVDASGNPDFTNVHSDTAPDPGHGFFTYQVLTKLTLKIAAFTTSPKPAKAGKTFVAGIAANESDTGGPVSNGTVTCTATIAGKRVAATGHGVSNGIATCRWRIPAKTKGKTIHGTIRLTVRGTTVSKSFAVRIA